MFAKITEKCLHKVGPEQPSPGFMGSNSVNCVGEALDDCVGGMSNLAACEKKEKEKSK